ncbi:MAG: MBL fold metallo-hydrolase [Lachnospiraceae bacterium]|nr:MBL fold metallo-hydrolase [Lachnospiraceae bacterium]
MKIREVKYSTTNTYLIEGSAGMVLFDTGWAGTTGAFRKAMGEFGIPVQKIDAVMVSHFHPDHMGIAQEIADYGAEIWVADVQKDYVHAADAVFAKGDVPFSPINEENVKYYTVSESRAMLKKLGIDGEVLHTPGHSEDSISLVLDSGDILVGDLNPLYELELHAGTQIGKSWEMLLAGKPKHVYYGHAKSAVLGEGQERSAQQTVSGEGKERSAQAAVPEEEQAAQKDLYALVKRILKYIDKRMPLDAIARKTGAGRGFVEDVARMYLTHQNVGVQGILDRIEIKNR